MSVPEEPAIDDIDNMRHAIPFTDEAATGLVGGVVGASVFTCRLIQLADKPLGQSAAFDADLAQRMSDRAVRILQATDAGELLPRIAQARDFYECRFCAYAERCWGLPT